MSSYHWEAQRKQKMLDKRCVPGKSRGASEVSSVREGSSAQSSQASSACSSGGSSVMTRSAMSTPPPSPTPTETKKDALPLDEELQRRLGMLMKREAQQPMSTMARSNLLKEVDGFHRAMSRRSAKLPGRYTSLDYAQQW
ncbi:Hypp9204 [Branchiostoma lanceolatum]|uniref:Hypp9204 protein n=1 Tax=Branchiostoma lanceolatum TaxID=7740 RepID=A0A8J9ZCH8_BRALA|nr:Hypp9204 [Branchiostoma lanceolatum]